MEIYSYHIDGDGLVLDGTCDKWFEILWTRRFFRGDDFTISLPPTPKNIALFSEGRVVEPEKVNPLTGVSEQAGIITSVSVTSGERATLTVTGQSFDGLLNRRILAEYESDDTSMMLIRRNAGDLANEKRRFAATVFDSSVDTAAYQVGAMMFKTLAEYTANVASSKGWGLQSYISHSTALPHIVISGRQFVDRSISQSAVKSVVFSDDYETATDFERQHTESGVVTGVVAGAKKQYNDVTHVDIEKYVDYFGDAQSYARIEKYQSVTPVTKIEIRGKDVEWTVLDEWETFLAADELAAANYVKATDYLGANIIVKDGWESKFAVGDFVTVKNTAWDMSADKQVSEVQEYWGADNITVTATLGEPPKTLIEILKRG